MRPRFQPEEQNLPSQPTDTQVHSVGSLVPANIPQPHPRFQVDQAASPGVPPVQQPESSPVPPATRTSEEAESVVDKTPTALNRDDEASADLWRQELAARLNRYRARKQVPKPRYPSLQLKFDDASWRQQPPTPVPENPVNRLAVAVSPVTPDLPAEVASEPEPVVDLPSSEPTAKILEFPRFFTTPHITLDELAEPVLDRPRILEVPEQLPPPPALGGILIEPQEQAPAERRPGFELPLNPPAISRRLMAGAFDTAVVLAAFAGFAYLACRVGAIRPTFREAIEISCGLIVCFWAAYQYLFLVYSGTTPGLKIAQLSLTRFSGEGVPRSLRRWRALASVLSGLSLGLGYAWCWLDEDQLCWHDRITRTYMAQNSEVAPHNAKSL